MMAERGLTYEPCAEADVPAVARLLSHAFAGPQEGSEKWVRTSGLEHVRVLRAEGGRDARPTACLLRVPMGQYFGGRSVGMIGIAGVAVGPESRGQGLAREIMREAIREIAAEGVPLSELYASTQALYRQVGYEQAGHRCVIKVPLHRIDVREREGELTPLGDGDMDAVRACYREFAPMFDGMLDRGEYVWRRVRTFRDEAYHGFGVRGPRGRLEGGGLEGYVFLNQARKPDTGRHDVKMTDLAFTTARAGRRLLGFLADYATVGDSAVFFGGPTHPILMLLGQQSFSVERNEYWMTRITRVKEAIEARGYSPAVNTEFVLDLADDLVPENAGLWRVRVRDGRAEATRATDRGPAWVKADIGGLASMYTGYLSARQAALIGMAEGSAAGLEGAGAAFGCVTGGAPWMGDFF